MPGRFPPPPDSAADQPPQSGAAPPGRPSIYPLDVGRLLAVTFGIFRFRLGAFIGTSLLIMLPALALVAVATAFVGEDLARAQQAQLDFAVGRPFDLADAFPWRAILVSVAGSVIVALAGYVAQAVAVVLTTSTAEGGRIPARTALSTAFARLLALAGVGLVTQLVVFAIVIGGMTVGLVLVLATASGGQVQPGIGVFGGLIVIVATVAAVLFVAVRWTFAVQVAMTQATGVMASLGRSWRLISGSSWRVLGYLLLLGLLIGLVGAIVSTIIGLITGAGFEIVDGRVTFEPTGFLIASLATSLLAAVLQPIVYVGLTLLYLDIRFRRGEAPTSAPDASAS